MKCKCGEEIKIRIYYGKRKKTYLPKYCSRKCAYEFRVRPTGLVYEITVKNKGWFKKGSQPSELAKQRAYQTTCKGENSGYDAKHDWIEKTLGKPKYCEICKETNKKIYQWSNKYHTYKKVKEDWQRLCVKCHQRYDYENFRSRKSFYE